MTLGNNWDIFFYIKKMVVTCNTFPIDSILNQDHSKRRKPDMQFFFDTLCHLFSCRGPKY